MLGWEVLVYRSTTPDSILARWTTGATGLHWLDELVKTNMAADLGGNGYPDRYAIAASVLLPFIKNGLPKKGRRLVIGDDYVLPEGWTSDVEWDQDQVLACLGSDSLVVEAWDQS
jgi:hypothetical protein